MVLRLISRKNKCALPCEVPASSTALFPWWPWLLRPVNNCSFTFNFGSNRTRTVCTSMLLNFEFIEIIGYMRLICCFLLHVPMFGEMENRRK